MTSEERKALALLKLKELSPNRYYEEINKIAGKEHKKQLEAHAALKAIIALFWGNRVGKTEWGGQRAARYLTNDMYWTNKDGTEGRKEIELGHTGWIFSPSFDMQLSGAQEKLMKYLPENQIEKIDYYKNNIIKGVYLKNGNSCNFKTYEQGREKVQAAGLRWAWLDEEPKYDIYREITVRGAAGQDLDIWLTMTPINGLTWTYDMLYMADDKSDIFVSTAGWDDNPHLTEKQKAQWIRGMSAEEIAVRKEGKFVSMVGAVCDWYRPEIHLIDDEEIPIDELSLYRSFDYGFSDPAVALFAGFSSNHTCYIYDGIRGTGLTDVDFAELVKAKSGNRYFVESYGDSNAPEAIETFNRSGIYTRPVDKMTGGTKSWDETLAKKLYEYGHVQDFGDGDMRPRLYIARSLVETEKGTGMRYNWLGREITQLRWAEKRETKSGKHTQQKKWTDTREYGHHFDAVRALAYLLYMYRQPKKSNLEVLDWDKELTLYDDII